MHIVFAANPEAAQPWVADAVVGLARQTGATVAVLVVDEVELERLAAVPRSVYTERAEQAVATAAARLAEAGIVATRTVLPGRPLERIMEFADEQGADLIVVGSSTRPTVAERLLGSVPLALIKKSSRPVLVVTHPGSAR